MQNKKYLLFVCIFIILATISSIFFWYFTKTPISNTQTTTNPVSNGAVVNNNVDQLHNLNKQTPPQIIQNQATSPTNSLPPNKQLIQEQYDKGRLEGAKNAAPRNPQIVFPDIPSHPFPVSLISDECEPEHAMNEALFTNCWKGLLNDKKMIVFAGVESHANPDIPDNVDRKQGLVVILNLGENTGAPPIQRVLTPEKVGSVKITEEKNGVLTLSSLDGARLLFLDLRSETFSSTTKK